MKTLTAAFAVSSFIAAVAGSAATPTVASAQPVGRTYVACNQYGDCWRVHQRYAYGPDAPIIYYNSDWYEAHRSDEHVRWLADPDNDRGYYDRSGAWHPDPGARSDGRRCWRGHRLYCDAPRRVRPWRGGWRRRGWRHGRGRRRSLHSARLI